MRIAFDAVLAQRNNSGVGNYIDCLLDSLDQAISIDTVEAYYPAPLASLSRWSKVVLKRVYGVTKSRSARVLWEQVLFPVLLHRQYDLLHMPAYVTPIVTDVPIVLTVHDTIALDQPRLCSMMNRLHFRSLMPRSIRRARHVIVPTDAVRAAVVRRCLAPPNKISVIHEGVRDLFRRQADPVVVNRVRESFGITGRVLLFVGNLEPKKNLQTLLAALELAKGHIPDLQLVLCGRMGWRTHAIQHALHRMRSPSDVILTGYVSTPILHALYALAEVFVFPSIIEGFGVPPLEAMACGTPVVVSNDAAISEVVGNSAIQVNPSDAPELATAIVSVLLSRDLRDELRERGLERSRCFTWAKTASETVAVYKDVCRQA